MVDFKEALAVLRGLARRLRSVGFGEDDFTTIRSALEAAQQEAEAWEAIEAWRQVTAHEFFLYGVGQDLWRIVLIDWGPKCERRCQPSPGTRAQMLRIAAAWCRAELAK